MAGGTQHGGESRHLGEPLFSHRKTKQNDLGQKDSEARHQWGTFINKTEPSKSSIIYTRSKAYCGPIVQIHEFTGDISHSNL